MANQNPTGGAKPVALKIPPPDRRFLRGVFTMARDGIRDELAEYPDELREPAQLHREEAAYEKLFAALRSLSIIPDAAIRQVLTDLAETIDRTNEYERVVAEHAALLGMRDQIRLGRCC
jgi:hypothetical protein